MKQAAALAMIVAAAEGIFFGFGWISMQRGNPFLLYSPSRLASDVTNLLPVERDASTTGWPRKGDFPTRADPASGPPCASAWGGSFTLSFDVADDEAWPHLLAAALGCRVENHGVGGFGMDQTLLQFREHPPSNTIVFLGISEPMLVAGGLSSWTFMSLTEDKAPRVSGTKPRFTIDATGLKLLSRPPTDREAVYRYIVDDMAAAEWTAMSFPFTASILHALWRKSRRATQFNVSGLGADRSDMAILRTIGPSLIAAMSRDARLQNNRLVLVLLPSPDLNGAIGKPLEDIARSAGASGACVVNPTEEMTEADHKGNLRSPSGHLSALGNKAVADATIRALNSCGIRS